MLKRFVKNIAFLMFLNLLIKPFWILGIDRTVQNVIGAESYGFYYAVLNFSFLFNILLDFGITNFNNKNIAQNNHLLRKHLSSIVVLKLILAIIYLVFSLIVAFILRYSFEHIALLLVLSFNQFLISFILYLRSNLAGLHLFKIDSVISVLDRFLMIFVCGIFLWGNLPIKFTINVFVGIQTLCYLLTAFITMTIVYKKAKSKFLKLNWSLPFSLIIIKNSYPYAVLVLLMAFYNRIDTVMIERMLVDGKLQSGIYASAYRLLDATNMLAFLFASLLLPIFSKMLKTKESVEELVKLSLSLLIVPAILIAIGCYYYSLPLMQLLYKDHIESSAKVFGLLMACFVPISSTYIFGTLLTANGNLKYLNITAACGMVINVSLNYFLIPHYFAVGSAVASLTTQFLTGIAQILIVQMLFKFKINYKLLFQILIFTAVVIGVNILSLNMPFHWMINFSVMVIISGIFAIAIKLFNIKALLQIIKYG